MKDEKLALEGQLDTVRSYRSLVTPKVGDILSFGTDALTKRKTSIPWIVIQVSDSQVALLSRDILGYGIFKSEYSKKSSYVDWLKEFEENAFSDNEKKALLRSPLDYYGCSRYAFVYSKMDAKNFLQDYLPAKPTTELLHSIQNDSNLDDFDKRGYANTVSSSYWLHSRDVWHELTVNRVKRNEKGEWEILTLNKVTNDEFTAGIRPAILVDRNQLAQLVPANVIVTARQQIDKYIAQLENQV